MKNEDIKLSIIGLPAIRDLNGLSLLTHISKATLYRLSKNPAFYYKVFYIPKKNGGKRKIAQPSRKLKGLQGWILANILNKLKSSSSSKGFDPKTNILHNATPHIGANALLSIDIENFFPSIKKHQVFNILRSIGYNNAIAGILTNLCTFNNELPQGSPCSPKLANLCCMRMDYRIQKYVGLKGITYTRYADDLTFSSLNPQKIQRINYTIKKIIESEDFKINESKTRFRGLRAQKKVTGLIINKNSVGIGRDMFRNIRAMLYQLTKYKNGENLELLTKTQGWIAYMKSVDQTRFNAIIKYIKLLKIKYKNTLIEEIKLETGDVPKRVKGTSQKGTP